MSQQDVINELVEKLEGEMAKYREITNQLADEQTKYAALAAELVEAQGKVTRLQMELAKIKNTALQENSTTIFRYLLDPVDKTVHSHAAVTVPILTDVTLRDQFPWGAGKFWEQRNAIIGGSLSEGESVLDLGGGFCHLSEYVTGRYVSLDKEAWTNVTIKADFNAGEFPDVGYFDVIVCQGVLEYMKEPLAFLKAIRKYGKRLFLSYQLGDRPDRGNSLLFTELREILQQAGWEIRAGVDVDSPTQMVYSCFKLQIGVPAYWWGEGKSHNWGDIFTEFLLSNCCEMKLELTTPEAAHVFGCGSVLEHIPNGFTGYVLGAGAMHEETRRDLSKAKGPLILRGDATLERCELGGQPFTLGDPGLLAYLFVKKPIVKKHDVGIIPHYAEQDFEAIREARARGYFIIDITAGIQEVIDAVASCRSIVSSSLHGLVLADSLDIPNRWIRFSNCIGGGNFKFLDYYSVFDEEPTPQTNLQNAINECRRRDTSSVKKNLLAALEQFKREQK
jgi:2-polyprenyl-3-methyl-5-hydroxy-6-metoxy-1,4-benzoquinol methylase